MTHKLIEKDNYLLVVDDSEIKVGDKCLCDIPASDYFGVVVYNGAFAEHYYKKIIAHIPLNGSPILEGVPLLPPYSHHQEDGLDELANHHFRKSEYEIKLRKESFIDGYNKAKEKYKYTEEDMRKAIDMATTSKHDSTLIFFNADEIIQSLHQYPTEFVSEDEISHEGNGTYSTDLMDIGVSNLKPIKVPKTITTAQGIQWVGKYI